MKKLILTIIATLIATLVSFAQETNYIKVTTEIDYEIEPEKYKAEVIISVGNAYDIASLNLERVKKKYFEKLKEKNINLKKLKENEKLYYMKQYDDIGTFLTFLTKNEEEFIRFLKVELNGVSIISKIATGKKPDSKKLLELKRQALSKAKEKAASLAKISNKKLGDIIAIEDHNIRLHDKSTAILSYYTEAQNTYQLTVSFKLE